MLSLHTCSPLDCWALKPKRIATTTTDDKRQLTQPTPATTTAKIKTTPPLPLIEANNVPPLRQTKGRSVRQLLCFLSLFISEHDASSHRSILEYLHSNGFAESFKSLASETGINHTPDPKSKYNGLLEKKWTSVIRLQKKVRF